MPGAPGTERPGIQGQGCEPCPLDPWALAGPSDHPNVANDLNDLALLLAATHGLLAGESEAIIASGRPEEARPEYWAPFVLVGEGPDRSARRPEGAAEPIQSARACVPCA